MSIQTFVVPGASKEGFLSRHALSDQARAQTLDVFTKVYAFPALFVTDISVGAPDKSLAKDATLQPAPAPQIVTLFGGGMNAFRYLHKVGFLVKRPGNPFPQFVSIGRAANNDLVFAVDSVSKFHGYFTLEGGRWAVTDFRSTNGTELNGKWLEPTVATPVADHARLRFGEHVHVEFLEPRSLYAKLRE